VILAFLQQFEKHLLKECDFAEILTILKSQNHLNQQNAEARENFRIEWDSLFEKAQYIQIDESFIYKMHSNFDTKNLWFRTTFLEK
jgi:hypothetical protein